MKVSIRFEYDETILPSFEPAPPDSETQTTFEVPQLTFDGWKAAKRAWDQAVAEMGELVNQREAEELAARQAEEAERQRTLNLQGQQIMDEAFGIRR